MELLLFSFFFLWLLWIWLLIKSKNHFTSIFYK